MDGALKELERRVQDGSPGYACFCSAGLLSPAMSHSDLGPILANAALVYPDGISTVALAKAWRQPVPERVPGPSFLLAACGYGLSRGWRHFFFGAQPGVAEELANRLREKFPGLQVVGARPHPFRELTAEEENALAKEIAQNRPHLLWVGLGAPRQERWMSAYLEKLDVPVMLGVGAAFDFLSGNRAWAPAGVRQSGFEWLFRTFTGGSRIFFRNCVCVPRTAWLVLCEFLAFRFQKPDA